jgi:phosphoglycerate dehydrogenase-like enzyme
VAEHTVLLILAAYKHLVEAFQGVRLGRWMEWDLRDVSFELYGKCLGLVGMGRIGRGVALRALAFGTRILYFDPLVPKPHGLTVRRAVSLQSLLAQADIVSLHVPLSRELVLPPELDRGAAESGGAGHCDQR